MATVPAGKNNKVLGIIGLIVIVAAIAVGATLFSHKPSNVADATATPTPTPVTSTLGDSATATPAARFYKDGTYSAQGSYDTPGGTETVNVSVTLKAGVVSDSTITTSGNTPTARLYQAQFTSGYKSQVTGKNINDIHLSRVSGSSLTSGGFNDALAQIETQAKA